MVETKDLYFAAYLHCSHDLVSSTVRGRECWWSFDTDGHDELFFKFLAGDPVSAVSFANNVRTLKRMAFESVRGR